MTQFLSNLLFLLLTVISPLRAVAGIETTATLPQKITSPEFLYNVISGLDEKFDSKGRVIGVADNFQLQLSGQNISKISAEGTRLVNFLNGLSATEKLGDSLYVGTVDFVSNPSLDYWVINPAYGVRNNLAVGFAIPIIHFKNEMKMISYGNSNVKDMQKYVGPVDQEMTEGFNKLEKIAEDPKSTVQSELLAKGYKALGSTEFNTIGDIQIYARYRYFENEFIKLAVRPYMLLPTGRSDDPHDLADIAVGGFLGFGTFLTNEITILPKWYVSLIMQYEAHLPDSVSKRVPTSSQDLLIKKEQTENVSRVAGNLYDISIGNTYMLTRALSAGAFYDLAIKDPDWYGGVRGYNYGLLAQDTNSVAHKLGGYITLSTTDLYFDKQAILPVIIGYTFSQVVSGINVPNQFTHIFNMRMFF